MTLQFPYPATLGQVYPADNGVTYTYDGTKWVAAGSGNPLVPVSQISRGSQTLVLNNDGSVSFPNYQFPSAIGPTGTILTSDGGGTVYWHSAGAGPTGPAGSAGPTGSAGSAGATGPAGTQPNSLINEQYSFSLDSSGFISMPDNTKLNSGGIGTQNSAEFGTVVSKNQSNVIIGSEIYMGSGTGEFRSITQGDGKTLTVIGVENPGFAGFVAMDDGFGPNQYAVGVDAQGIIHINGTSVGYTAALGVATTNGGINGILSNANTTSIVGGLDNPSRITINDSAATIRTGAGEDGYGLWINEFGNFVSEPPLNNFFGLGVVHDSTGNLYTFGQVIDIDRLGNTNLDTLAIKYDARGRLEWRKFYRPTLVDICGITNDFITIDENDNLYFMASNSNQNPSAFYVGRLDSNGNATDFQGNAIPRYLKINGFMGVDIEAHVRSYNTFLYIAGTDLRQNDLGYVLRINASNAYSIDWAYQLLANGSPQSIKAEAITVNPNDGNVYVLGQLTDSSVPARRVVLLIFNNSGTLLLNKGLTPDIGYAYDQEVQAIKFYNGYVYTSIFDTNARGSIISKINNSGTIIWSTYIDYLSSPHTTIVSDIDFDESGNILLMGFSDDNSDSINAIYFASLYDSDGHPNFHRLLTNGQIVNYITSSTRLGSVYKDRVSFGSFAASPGGGGGARAITTQLLADGSGDGVYGDWVYVDVTLRYNNRSINNFTMILVDTDVTVVDCSQTITTSTHNLNTTALIDENLNSVRTTMIQDVTGAVYAFGQDGNISVPPNTNINTSYGNINITASDKTWTFDDDGSLTGPGPIQSSASGIPEFKSATDLNLTATNRVNIKTSPLNLAPFTSAMLSTIAGKNGDLVFSTTSKNILTFADGGWRTVVRTSQNNDIVLIGQGTVRNSGGVGVAYQNDLPRDISDLTDNKNLLPADQLAMDLDVDGGGAYAVYDGNLMRADGGFSSARYGRGSTVFDGGSNATGNNYTMTINGGGA